jgi:phosphoserine phosphatase
VPAFREGKITRVQDWLAAEGLALESFERSLFYSDSTNDLPLLERVSHPVATNPGPALERLARAARLAHPETLPHD